MPNTTSLAPSAFTSVPAAMGTTPTHSSNVANDVRTMLEAYGMAPTSLSIVLEPFGIVLIRSSTLLRAFRAMRKPFSTLLKPFSTLLTRVGAMLHAVRIVGHVCPSIGKGVQHDAKAAASLMNE